MRVLLCERFFSGHRRIYMDWLSNIPDIEFYCYAPENVGVNYTRFYKYDRVGKQKKFIEYYKWTKKIKEITYKNSIDLVHILDGDSIMRFFGFGLGNFGTSKVAITYHHFFAGKLRRLSYRFMSNRNKTISIVHTQKVKILLEKCGISNIKLCEYPAFNFNSISNRNSSKCKKRFHLLQEIPVIGIIGGINSYKSILPFLQIMGKCKMDFHILLCGKEGDVSKEMIMQAVNSYSIKTTIIIGMLSEDDYESAIMASDIIFSIYGLSFEGASGPMIDGVCAKKMILSCAHGSLGDIVQSNHLGLITDCTNGKEILETTENALNIVGKFKYDKAALEFREQLKPDEFQRKYKKIYLSNDLIIG